MIPTSGAVVFVLSGGAIAPDHVTIPSRMLRPVQRLIGLSDQDIRRVIDLRYQGREALADRDGELLHFDWKRMARQPVPDSTCHGLGALGISAGQHDRELFTAIADDDIGGS